MSKEVKLEIPEKLLFFLTDKARYKIAHGGRGSAKSHSVARAFIIKSLQESERFLCTRELQTSIQESVHKLLCDVISQMGFNRYFNITQNSIRNYRGSEFIFKGLRNNIFEIKSLEGIKYCWIEEAAKVSSQSLDMLIPTIRKEESEIWMTLNLDEERDPVYQRFIKNPSLDSIVREVNYYDNPFFPEVLRREMELDRAKDYDRYCNVWLGKIKKNSEAKIFNKRYQVRDFQTPKQELLFQQRFFHGIDWGFANDPLAFTRSFIYNGELYIDREIGGIGIELDDIPALLDNNIDNIRKWKIFADNARPETISHIKRKGFIIEAAPKWSGSVEDGIAYLRNFNIIIHPRCVQTINEFQNYSYKIDRLTEEVLPIIEDCNNHYIDSLRYAHSSYIQRKTSILEVI